LGAIVVLVEVVVAAEPATLNLEAAEHVHRQLPFLLDKIPLGAHRNAPATEHRQPPAARQPRACVAIRARPNTGRASRF
jgi:hypothetical protein